MLTAAQIQAVLDPPLATGHLSGVGGVSRGRPLDFKVIEIPAYAPDGKSGHLFLRLVKTGLSTEEAVQLVGRGLGLPRMAVGVAGLKDKDAVTEQWISVPESVAGAIGAFRHPSIQLLDPAPHGQKLRRGHLRGNRFQIVLRELDVDLETARQRIEAKVRALTEAGGLWNLYGEQRFSAEGRNLEPAFAKLVGRSGRRDIFLLSVAQSALFNLVLLERVRRNALRKVLRGDILRKTDTGGMFECADPEADQRRLDAGEVALTGPMFGSRMRSPSATTPAADLEASVLDAAGLAPAVFAKLGKSAPGARRNLQIPVDRFEVLEAEPVLAEGLGPGVCLTFPLPTGSYATVLLREIQAGESREESS